MTFPLTSRAWASALRDLEHAAHEVRRQLDHPGPVDGNRFDRPTAVRAFHSVAEGVAALAAVDASRLPGTTTGEDD